jgi:hypothetical protein
VKDFAHWCGKTHCELAGLRGRRLAQMQSHFGRPKPRAARFLSLQATPSRVNLRKNLQPRFSRRQTHIASMI